MKFVATLILLVTAAFAQPRARMGEYALVLEDAPMAEIKRPQYLPPVSRDLNAAVSLVNASAAWSAVGGTGTAGAGIKIGIIDTGIDQTHRAFQDPSLTPPSGFPKGDAAYTNNKVFVARSYVPMLRDTG